MAETSRSPIADRRIRQTGYANKKSKVSASAADFTLNQCTILIASGQKTF
ncbi:MAG: hypothetical protein JZU65_16715 [Chlorobium sp.]|nr:hypothetical protein [Chlorobium sp.]